MLPVLGSAAAAVRTICSPTSRAASSSTSTDWPARNEARLPAAAKLVSNAIAMAKINLTRIDIDGFLPVSLL